MSNQSVSSTTEERVAQTILQEPIKIKVGNKEYAVAPPSVATLVLVSAAISRLPRLTLNEDDLVQEALNVAKDCEPIGDIIAVMILGAKHVKDEVVRVEERVVPRCFGLFKRKMRVEVRESKREQLSRELLENLSPRELQTALAQILGSLEVGDFFGLTTFLLAVNTIRPTKVENQTVSGQQ